MNDHSQRFWRERAALRYLDALDAGDPEALAGLWEQARADPELEALLCELNEGLIAEEILNPSFEEEAARVLELTRRHVPSGFPPAPPDGPLTAGDVAARLHAESAQGARLEPVDREANAKLLGNPTPLPDQLALSHLERWSMRLDVVASPRYWRAFHKAAVLLAMARAQGPGRLAAARRAGPKPESEGTSP